MRRVAHEVSQRTDTLRHVRASCVHLGRGLRHNVWTPCTEIEARAAFLLRVVHQGRRADIKGWRRGRSSSIPQFALTAFDLLAMPSNTTVDMLLALCADLPDAFEWDTFQAQTGFAVAPFSGNCSADDVNMSDDDYDSALAAFDVYDGFETATDRHNFLSGKLTGDDAYYTEGRNLLKTFVGKGWKDWGFLAITKKVMGEMGFDFDEYHRVRELGSVRRSILLTPAFY